MLCLDLTVQPFAPPGHIFSLSVSHHLSYPLSLLVWLLADLSLSSSMSHMSLFSPSLDAEVHYINMAALTKGNLHSSFWVVDRKHFYIGSASMDWRSLATVLPPYFTIPTEILTETLEKKQPNFTSVISEAG